MSAASFTVDVRPEFFEWARLSSGYSAEDLAKAAGVQPHAWSEWEEGRARPTFRQLERVAHKCRRPISVFYLPQPPPLEPNPEDFRRRPGAASQFAPETLLAFRIARRLQRVAAELLGRPAEPPAHRVPQAAVHQDSDAVAADLRSRLGVSIEDQGEWRDEYAAYRGWRTAIEGLGVLTFQFSLPLGDARGFSLWDEQYPAVAANSQDAVTARCFTIIHELAHLVLRRPGVSLIDLAANSDADEKEKVERFCNRVAAGVLLPRSEPAVQDRLRSAAREGRPVAEKVSAAAAAFRVSRPVVLWRMVEAGLAEPAHARSLARQWTPPVSVPAKKAGGGPPPEARRLAERGPTLTVAVLDALDEGRISPSDAVDYLDLPSTRFPHLGARLHSPVDAARGGRGACPMRTNERSAGSTATSQAVESRTARPRRRKGLL